MKGEKLGTFPTVPLAALTGAPAKLCGVALPGEPRGEEETGTAAAILTGAGTRASASSPSTAPSGTDEMLV